MKTFTSTAIFSSSLKCFMACVYTDGKMQTPHKLAKHMCHVLARLGPPCAQESKKGMCPVLAHSHPLAPTERVLRRECKSWREPYSPQYCKLVAATGVCKRQYLCCANICDVQMSAWRLHLSASRRRVRSMQKCFNASLLL